MIRLVTVTPNSVSLELVNNDCYYTNEYEGELKSSDEGEVMWINYFKDKNRYHLSEGLEELIDLILSNK